VLVTKLRLRAETETIPLDLFSMMVSMDPAAAPVPPSDAQNLPSEMDVIKRDAVNGVSSAEEPPAKKARLEETSENKEEDHRSKGIAPIKAEYVCPAFPSFAAD
jgi:hypothetical protein